MYFLEPSVAVRVSGELRASCPSVEPLSWRLDLKHTPREGVAGTGVLILGGMVTAAGPVLDPLLTCPEELLAVNDGGQREGALVPAAEGQSHLPAAERAPVWPALVRGDTGSRCGGVWSGQGRGPQCIWLPGTKKGAWCLLGVWCPGPLPPAVWLQRPLPGPGTAHRGEKGLSPTLHWCRTVFPVARQ